MEKQDEFRALKSVTLEQLAKLLYIRQDTISEYDCTQWLTGQARQIKNLNSTLVPTALKSAAQGLLNFSQAFDPKPGHGPLCSVHSALNADILDVLRDLVIRECTTHTDRYRHRRQKHCLSPLLSNWLTRVDEISVLWMGKEHWQQRMRREVAITVPWSATKPCMACQLAVVGGSARFLTDLKASLVAREQYSREIHQRKDSLPGLLPMVDAWINMCYPKDQRRGIHDESRMLAGMVFAMRDQMRQVRETTDRRYHRATTRETTETGLPMPRSVSRREHERETKRRENGEFYGERDSGWLWSPNASGAGSSSGGPDFSVSAKYGGEDQLFLNGPRESVKESQSSGIMSKIDADWYVAGYGSRSTSKDVASSSPCKSPKKAMPVDSLAERVNQMNLFRSWNESGALNNGDYSHEERQAMLQRDVDIYKGADFVRTGDALPLGEPRYFFVPDQVSDKASNVNSAFTISPIVADDEFPRPAPSSKYSTNPGPPPSTLPSLPSPKPGPSTELSVQQEQQQIHRGARNRERTPPRRHRREGSDEAVNGDEEGEYWVAPKPLAQRRVLNEYRTQIQPTRPPVQLGEVAKGRVGLVSAEDVASCYAGMGWGGPRKR